MTLGSRRGRPRCGRAGGKGDSILSRLLLTPAGNPLERNTKCRSIDLAASAQDPKNLPVEFEFDATLVRTIAKEGQAWFVAKDVCDILDIDNPSQAVARLDEDEKGITTTYTTGGARECLTVNEFGSV